MTNLLLHWHLSLLRHSVPAISRITTIVHIGVLRSRYISIGIISLRISIISSSIIPLVLIRLWLHMMITHKKTFSKNSQWNTWSIKEKMKTLYLSVVRTTTPRKSNISPTYLYPIQCLQGLLSTTPVEPSIRQLIVAATWARLKKVRYNTMMNQETRQTW